MAEFIQVDLAVDKKRAGLTLYSIGSNSARRRRGKRKSVREVEGDVADCEEEIEYEEERER